MPLLFLCELYFYLPFFVVNCSFVTATGAEALCQAVVRCFSSSPLSCSGGEIKLVRFDLTVAHGLPFVECVSCVVYAIPFSSWEGLYRPSWKVSQLQNEKTAIFSKSHPIRSRGLTCERLSLPGHFFSSTGVWDRLQDKTARKIARASSITCRGSQSCFSSPSLSLRSGKSDMFREMAVLERFERFPDQKDDVL